MEDLLFTVSLDDGVLSPAAASLRATATGSKWIESDLQHLLLLNPQLLGVSDHLPLELDGGSTAVRPDQLYVDDVGRFVIVEIKNEPAGISAMAQLLAYSEHWRLMPLGEMELGFRAIARRGTSADILGASLRELRELAGSEEPPAARDRQTVQNPWRVWPENGAGSVMTFARGAWGDHALTMPGAPTRMVLIAPAFDDACVALAAQLSSRYVSVELIRAAIVRGDDNHICLSWQRVVEPPRSMAPTWAAARRLWRAHKFRECFTPNAWADHLSKETFSFSSRAAPAVKIWLAADGPEVTLSTAIPDGWYTGTPQRAELRQTLLESLPHGHSGGRWPTWSFTLPAEAERFDECAGAVAKAICDVLVPAAKALTSAGSS